MPWSQNSRIHNANATWFRGYRSHAFAWCVILRDALSVHGPINQSVYYAQAAFCFVSPWSVAGLHRPGTTYYALRFVLIQIWLPLRP